MNNSEKDSDFLYEKIASNLEANINNGIMKDGEKLPSVRQMSAELGVSASTIFKAYYDIEAKGLIEARPKSGYYVRKLNDIKFKRIPKQPYTIPCKVSTQSIIGEVTKNQHDPSFLSISSAMPHQSLLPANQLRKSLQKVMLEEWEDSLNYEPNKGNYILRAEICKLALSWGRSFSPDEIMITNGCMEAFSLALRAITKPGDAIALETPAYFRMVQLLEQLGLKIVEIPVGECDQQYLKNLEEAVDKFDIKAFLVISNFNNPTGICLSDALKKKIVNLAGVKGFPIIEDDVYGELYFGNNRPVSFKTFDKNDSVIYCASFSKVVAPGFRIGWSFPGKYLQRMEELKSSGSYGNSSISQRVMAHYLQKGRYSFHLKKMRKSLKCLRNSYINAIKDNFPNYVKVNCPPGNFLLWIELPEGFDAYKLFRSAVEQKINIAPGQIFSASGSHENFFRLSYGQPLTSEVLKGIRQLGILIKQMNKSN